jgi:flagellin
MSSILTNNSAMVALQTLKGINKDLNMTQSAISTGKEIASAKDNSAIWAISKVMESDVSGFEAVSDSLALGEATVGVALAGAEQITNLLNDMKEKVVAATGENVDHTKMTADITELTNQITAIVAGSQFNGTNLLNDDGTPLVVLASINRQADGSVAEATNTTITVNAVDFTSNLDLSDIDVSSAAAAQTSVEALEAHIQTAVNGAAALGASANRISEQAEFVGKVTDSMKSGIGALVDTDMEAASARLQALQTQQQLGVQALSIANQAPQTILSLFR